MIRAVGVAVTAAFLTASLVGTVASGWRLRSHAAYSTPANYAIALAMLAETLRFALALQSERIWQRSHFTGTVIAVPLWLACTVYCTLMPLLALAVLFIAPSSVLTPIAAGWIFIQVAAGLLPGIAWPGKGRQGAAAAPLPLRSMPSVTMPAIDKVANERPKVAASADDLLQTLARQVSMARARSLCNLVSAAAPAQAKFHF